MKTEQVLTRKMGILNVKQRISDKMFNATYLIEQWNKLNPDKKKRVQSFWDDNRRSIHEFMMEMDSDLNSRNSCDLEIIDFQLLRSKYTNTKRGKHNGGTWMNPYLFIKFAMWVSPKFEYHVVKFVYDQLVNHRHDAGDNYKEFSAALSKFNPASKDRSNVAKALNYVVFNKHSKELRNTASNKQMEDLKDLEKRYAYLINEEYIKSPKELIGKLRKEWESRYIPF